MVTVESICKRAQINRTTFYKHYKDKYDLLDNYLDRFLVEFNECASDLFDDAELTVGIYHNLNSVGSKKATDFIIARKDFCKVLWEQNFGRNFFREMVLILAKKYVDYKLKSDPSIADDQKKYSLLDLFSRILAATYMHAIRWWIINDSIVSEKEFNEMFCDILEKGLVETFREQI